MKKITRFTPVKGAPKAPIKSASRDRMYGGSASVVAAVTQGEPNSTGVESFLYSAPVPYLTQGG